MVKMKLVVRCYYNKTEKKDVHVRITAIYNFYIELIVFNSFTPVTYKIYSMQENTIDGKIDGYNPSVRLCSCLVQDSSRCFADVSQIFR